MTISPAVPYASFIDIGHGVGVFLWKKWGKKEGTDNCFIDDIRFEFYCNRLTENCGLASE